MERKDSFAELFYELELRQTKTKSEDRFIKPEYIELTFHRVAANGIHENSYKFLSLDYDEIRQKTKQNLQQFIADKYYAITGNRNQPIVLHRKVALFDPSIKINSKRTETLEGAKDYKVEGLFSSFINAEKPAFLFGELGSGKSTLVANYLLSIIEDNPEMVPIFISSSYLQDKEFKTIEALTDTINRFVNNELLLTDKQFKFDTLFKTNKETVLIIDGIDELLIARAQTLLSTLKKLKDSSSLLRIIATGRPLEMEGIVPTGWHTLTTIPLKDDEIKVIFKHEALANGITDEDIIKDTEERFEFLKNRNELRAIATTPLVICSIWPDLTESIQAKSLGDLLYNVVLRRLAWHEKDQKDLELTTFFDSYPSIYQRESLLAILADEIFYSPSKSIPESTIDKILSSTIQESNQKNKIVHEAGVFLKTVFLQRTTDDKYGFVSVPLLECAVGIKIAEDLKKTTQQKELFLNWRAFSFAMAISRRKEETNHIRETVSTIINKEVKWPSINLAPAAIILSELRDTTLSKRFIETLERMEFRPIRPLERNDQLSLYSFAYCLVLAEEKGFSWMFEEYLEGKTPLIHYEAKMIADVLGYYFLICDFNISVPIQQQLNSIIQPNINFATSLCWELLPTLSLIDPGNLNIQQKCLLLADLLKDDVLRFRSENKLIEISQSHPSEVLNALETVCQKKEFTENARAALLWLQINNSKPISISVLTNALTSITKENIKETFTALSDYIKEEDLLAYLRFCIITRNKLAEQASLILFWKEDKNFDLLSTALITSIDWLSQQYAEVNEIAEFISAKKDTAADLLIKNMPLSNHLGIPPAYWRIFLDTLISTDTLHLSAFADIIENMRFHILTRYPDIRIRLATLLNNKPAYKDFLKQLAKRLNTSLRNNANAVLLTCYPDLEADSLRKTIAGFFKSSSNNEEWQSFCFGLNYSKETLDHLYKYLGTFTEAAKAYALTLLHYHKYPLSENETNDLIHGLLGPGYFFDRSTIKFSESPSGVLGNPLFFDKIIPILLDPEIERAERAASVLLDYHYENLITEQRAIAWNLRIEWFEQSFFKFALEHQDLLLTKEFTESIPENIQGNKEETLLSLFSKAQNVPDSWKNFLMRFILKSERFDHHILLQLHGWLISYIRRFPDKKAALTESLGKILLLPSYKENSMENNIYLYLLLIADEFGISDKSEINRQIQITRQYFINEELLCALAFRSGFNAPSGFLRGVARSHVTLFAPHNPSYIAEVPMEELEGYLIDSENISKGLLPNIERILLYGQLNQGQLDSIFKKSTVGSYFAMIAGFCRNNPVPIVQLLEIREIGGVKAYQLPQTEVHRQIVQRLYRQLLNSTENRAIYINALKKELDNPNTEYFNEYVLEVLSENEAIELKHFNKLLELLLDRPYLLKENLAYYLSMYFANNVGDEEMSQYDSAIQSFLSAIINQSDKEGQIDQYNLILWLFALASLKLADVISDDTRDAFLLGLRYVFLEKNSMERALIRPPEIFFKAGDLFNYTYPLFTKIESTKIKSIIEFGVASNIPEISACCRILSALSGKRNELS